MNCYCGQPALQNESLCHNHWIEAKYEERGYLDNSDETDLGILKWANDLLTEYLPQQTPWFHINILMLLLSLFDPFYKNRLERQINIISFRGSSKSTLVNFIFTIYILCHIGKTMIIKGIDGNPVEVLINEKFIVLCSETGMSAEDFAVRLRDEFTSNANLRFFYGLEIRNAYDALDGQWTKRAFKINGCFVMSAGVGQQIRGKIKGASRPTFIINDDIYSENNTKTEEGRRTVKRWFDSAVQNTLDDLLGKIAVIGTILHEDTVLIENKRSANWKTVEFPVMPLEKFQKFTSEHLQIAHQEGTCKLPYEDKGLNEFELKTAQREYFAKLTLEYDWELAWPERIDLYFLALKYQDAITKSSLGSLYQEYFHMPVSDEMKRIKAEYFRHIEDYSLYEEYGYLWFKCDLFKDSGGNQIPFNIETEIGIDVGTGTPDGDESVATVSGALSNGYKVVIKQVAGKYDLRDVRDDTGLLNLGTLIIERNKLKSIGILDEALRLALEYKVKTIKVGYAGSEKNNVTLLSQLAFANKLYNIMVVGRRQDASEGHKRERILNKLAPYYQSYSVLHTKGLDVMETQLQFLMKSTSDDRADSCFVKDTMIMTKYGNKSIQSIEVGDKVLTPIGFKKVTAISARDARVVNKFGFRVTPNHKFYSNNSFISIDNIEVPLYFSKANIKELLRWNYCKLKSQILYPNRLPQNSMGLNSGNANRENIIFLASLLQKNESVLKDFIYIFGNILMECRFRQAIMFITKILIASITIPIILKLWRLKNMKHFIKRQNLLTKNIGLGLKNIWQKFAKRLQNGIRVQQVKNGIKNIMKNLSIDFIQPIITTIFACSVVKPIQIQNEMANIVLQNVGTNLGWRQLFAQSVGNQERLEKTNMQKLAEEVVQPNLDGGKEKVYNIQVEEAGCYYANGVLVSNCEVALFNIQQPSHIDINLFKKQSRVRWKAGQRIDTGFDWRINILLIWLMPLFWLFSS